MGNSSPISNNLRPIIGIVLPLANEERIIEGLLARILVHLESQDRVFCVLDNVSKDRTRVLVEELSDREPRIKVIWAPENRCVVDAYFRGYRAAYQAGCQWILEMDGGLSHLPEEIPQFLFCMMKGFDYVGGSRFMKGGTHRSPLTRVWISKGGTWLAQWLWGSKMTDMTSGFECFHRSAMQHILEKGVLSRANFFQTEIRVMMHDYKWCEVPIQYNNTNYAVGRSSIRDALRVLYKLYQEK